MKFEAPADIEPVTKREAPRELIEAYEIRQRTSDLEARYEAQVAREEVEKKAFVTKLLTGLKKRGEGALRIAVLMAMLGLGESAVSSDKDEDTSAKKAAIHEIEGSYADRSLGQEVSRAAKDAGFVANMQIASPNGRYIVHIGQTHYVEGVENNVEQARRIADAQRSIEKVLAAFARSGTTNIFCEGFVKDGSGSGFLKQFQKSVWDKARMTQPKAGCFEALADACNQETKWYGNNFTSDSLVLTIKHIFKMRAYEMRSELEKSGALSDADKSSFESALPAFAPSGSLQKFGDDAEYLVGAESKLEEEGALHILPAETQEGNAAAFRYNPLRDKAAKEYFGVQVTIASLEHVRDLAQKYDAIRKLDEKATMTDREDIAVSIIAEYAKNNPKQMLFPIDFGNAHDFKDNVDELNRTNAIKFGLIKLSRPKDTK